MCVYEFEFVCLQCLCVNWESGDGAAAVAGAVAAFCLSSV